MLEVELNKAPKLGIYYYEKKIKTANFTFTDFRALTVS